LELLDFGIILKIKTMKQPDIKELFSRVKKLPYPKYREFKDRIKVYDKKKEVANLIENSFVPKCGHCGSKKYSKYGVRNDLQRYKCNSCGKTFNILTGTPLSRLRKKGRWLNYARCMSEGMTLQVSADLVGVDLTTSFRWRHTFLSNANDLKPKRLNGVVEAVDSYFYYSEKGSNFPSSISKEVIGKRAPKVYVLTTRDRNGNTNEEIIGDFNVANVPNSQLNRISPDVLLCSNKNGFYDAISKQLKIVHAKLRRSEVERRKIIHVKNAYKYKESLYDWMEKFKGVATKYLSNYLSWYRELDEYNMEIPPELMLLRARSIEEFPYQPLTPK
jgi:transposase-like protein